MIIPLLYIVPALWIGTLLAIWLNWILVWGLADIPAATLAGAADGAMIVLIAGLLMAGIGFFASQWELLYHKKAPYNVDAIAIYAGSILVLLAFLVSPTWHQWLGLLIAAVLLGTHACIGMFRTLMKWTRTAMASISLVFAYVVILGGWTYITWTLA